MSLAGEISAQFHILLVEGPPPGPQAVWGHTWPSVLVPCVLMAAAWPRMGVGGRVRSQ